ncbi:hypothetical protein [Labedaea rhizosphaerae]|uniref:Uncharacterized protein n=1 Tax=Labedaea rhizosphaerae TaxID=598644 RepID=A0A4R6SL10_LABRH|nr:hypothetical protein [Labedaea rhizosphaerae]TDQ04541.1 hypothetical protein EV186_101493 [Labedaea rhizosphaerae]
MQDGTGGGWPLRVGEEPHLLFAFYPSLAIAQLLRNRTTHSEKLVRSLCRSAAFLHEALTTSTLTVEEQLLGHFAYERIESFMPPNRIPSLAGLRRQTVANCWDSVHGLQLKDRPIVIHRQPVWHSITWHPLFYLCVRKWLPPLDAVSSSIGGALTRAFDNKIDAWSGPSSVRSGSGTSWASALALRATVALAIDLTRSAVDVDEFMPRVAQVDSLSYRYDVAIGQ